MFAGRVPGRARGVLRQIIEALTTSLILFRLHGVRMVWGAIATVQFYLYGRRHCTANGWRRASAKYEAGLHSISLSGRAYVVTGANAGLGRCLSDFLAARGATLYLICRDETRGQMARKEIVEVSGNANVHLLVGDCGVSADMRRVAHELALREEKLDGLVCNAGAITSQRMLTCEGLEVTLATHLVCGSFVLQRALRPLMERAPEPRVILVASGGLYNTKWPGWEVAAATAGPYSQELQYCYAKRGQLLLAEQLQRGDPSVRYVSCHPGWVDTPGVEGWLGRGKAALAPLRTLWQGTEGIAWLCSAPWNDLEGGAFYLDRSPAPKHLAGAFFSEGTYTKNTEAEVAELMRRLEAWADEH